MTTINTIRMSDGLSIPAVGFGTWQIKDAQAEAAVLGALAAGYRHIDTAASYNNEAGVGRAIAASGLRRDELFVTTKLWNADHAPAAARAAIGACLERLGLDRVDLFLIHWPTPQRRTHVAAWESLLKFREEGLASSVGVSNFTADHLDDLVAATGEAPAVNQIELHPTFTQKEMRAKHAALGVVTEAWSPIGQSQDLAEPALVEIAKEVGRSPAQVVLRWHLQQPMNIAIPRSSNAARIRENIDLFGFSLSPEEMQQISRLARRSG